MGHVSATTPQITIPADLLPLDGRFGAGLRWSFMGTLLVYRIAVAIGLGRSAALAVASLSERSFALAGRRRMRMGAVDSNPISGRNGDECQPRFAHRRQFAVMATIGICAVFSCPMPFWRKGRAR